MARAKRTGGMIPRRAAAGPQTLVNFHNQAVARAEYHGPRGRGFTVEFLHERAARDLNEGLVQGVAAIRTSAVSAVVATTDEVKQQMRSFLDAHFTGSAMHANNHRRVSNASVQSVYYEEIEEKGQFTGLIYSKFGYRGAGGFVDFLLLHIEGGTVRPKSGDWLRIPAAGNDGNFGQTGHFPLTDRDIFFAADGSGKKLFLMRRERRARGGRERGVELIATLVKSVTVQPSLAGLKLIMASRGAIFERNFNAIFDLRMGQGVS